MAVLVTSIIFLRTLKVFSFFFKYALEPANGERFSVKMDFLFGFTTYLWIVSLFLTSENIF